MPIIDNFSRISAIPRESGNEEGVRRFLLGWAKEQGLKAQKDETGNVFIYCPATKGFENVPTLALQGHMDMVCVKTDESKHDFTKDPIELVIKGDMLSAKDTSLGADNGIGIATIMELFSDKSLEHGPLEGILTISEETGLNGVYGLDTSMVHARKLINLDSEEEGLIYIGCAGGNDIRANAEKPMYKATEKMSGLSIAVHGLLGGHSGGEIHKQRANAIKTMARLLFAISEVSPVFIGSMEGGTRRNVIPSSCTAEFLVPTEFLFCVKEAFEKEAAKIRNEYRFTDPAMAIELDSAVVNEAWSDEDSLNLIKTLFMVPHGVQAYSFAIPGIVETSCNLAIISLKGGKLFIQTSQRSNIDSANEEISNRVSLILGLTADVVFFNHYPAWAPDPDNELAKLCAKVWKESTGKDATITAIHAGLECGILNSRIEGLESISIGPDMADVHSVNEHVSISSVNRIYEFLKSLISTIR